MTSLLSRPESVLSASSSPDWPPACLYAPPASRHSWGRSLYHLSALSNRSLLPGHPSCRPDRHRRSHHGRRYRQPGVHLTDLRPVQLKVIGLLEGFHTVATPGEFEIQPQHPVMFRISFSNLLNLRHHVRHGIDMFSFEPADLDITDFYIPPCAFWGMDGA